MRIASRVVMALSAALLMLAGAVCAMLAPAYPRAGLLAQGLLSDAMTKVADLQEDVDNLCSRPAPAPAARDGVRG